MSLNRTLTRLFDEIRREAKRNPRFADKLDAILSVHSSNRALQDALDAEALEDDAEDIGDVRRAPQSTQPQPQPRAVVTPKHPISEPRLGINPIALFTRGGADAVRDALLSDDWPLPALRELVAEHHLDPAGVAGDLDRAALVDHVVTQARKRIERDRKLFDY